MGNEKTDPCAASGGNSEGGDDGLQGTRSRQVSIGGYVSGSTIITGNDNKIVVGPAPVRESQPSETNASARPLLSGQQTLWIVVGFVSGMVTAILGNILAGYLQERYGLATPGRIAFVVVPFVLFGGLGLLAAVKQAHADSGGQSIGSPPTLHTLRAPVADLTGRESEIDVIVAHLCDEQASAPIAIIRGMGGVGKTELALAVAERAAPHFPDAHIWRELQLDGKPTSAEQLAASIIRALRPEAALPISPNELLPLYRTVLAGKRGILLLDNVSDAAQVRPLLPAPAGWATIVTSRQHFGLDGAFPRDLGGLAPEQAHALLRKMLATRHAGPTDEEVNDLAEVCGYLPLALRLAGEYLTTYRNEPVSSYLSRLRVSKLRHLGSKDRSVAATLGVSVARLKREDRRLALRWRQLAVFSAPFDLQAAAAVWDLSEEKAQDSLNRLCALSVVEYEGHSGFYRLHDLLREYALQPVGLDRRVAADATAVRRRHADHYLARVIAARCLYGEDGERAIEALTAFDSLWPHLEAAWLWTRCRSGWVARQWLIRLAGRTALLMEARLTPKQRLPILESALAAALRLRDDEAEGVVLSNAGLAYYHLGEIQRAIEYQQRALTISRKRGDRRAACADLNNLGIAFLAASEVQQAIRYFEMCLQRAREASDLQCLGKALDNLGVAYGSLGEQQRATECFQERLEIAREVKDRRGESAALGNLGNIYLALNEVQRAMECYRLALAVGREIGDRRSESTALGNLGRSYAALGEPRRAIEHYKQAIAIDREAGDRYGQAVEAWNLGVSLARLGQFADAAEQMQVAVDYEREIGHPNAEKDAQQVEKVRRKAQWGSREEDTLGEVAS